MEFAYFMTTRKSLVLKRLALVAVTLVFASGLIAPSQGKAPERADPTLAPWFRSLTNPNHLGLSCCAEADGHILHDEDWRTVGNHYSIRIAGEWWDVPPQAVLDHVGNPTGGAVAFYPAANDAGADYGPGNVPNIYCFVRPTDS